MSDQLADDMRVLKYVAEGPKGLLATFDRDRAKRLYDRITYLEDALNAQGLRLSYVQGQLRAKEDL